MIAFIMDKLERGISLPLLIKMDLLDSIMDEIEIIKNEFARKNIKNNKYFKYYDNDIDIDPENNTYWLKKMREKESDAFKLDNFFTFINHSRKIIHKDSQSFTCYGYRTNE